MRIRTHTLVLVLVMAAIWGSGIVHAQDFRVLRDTRPPNPLANLIPLTLDPTVVQPRVLLAGDSWAQYMWDDGSHNEIFDRFGHGEKRMLSESLPEDPGPGYVGPEYSISGSEARQWVDTTNYPWIANMVAALQANPTIDTVVLSIGGNDVLAGKSDGGWYKDMDLDVPGSEAALFQQIQDDTFVIIDAALAVRPDLRVVISSYDYPNFNVGFWCFLYACPKRDDLSRDPNNDLITDAELNGMMVTVEDQRIDWVNGDPRVDFDHAVGLMHYFYGDGVSGPLELPRPGQVPPLFAPFPGGNPVLPTLRQNFRNPGLDADPIHLDEEGYEYKIVAHTEASFFPEFRGDAVETFFSQGGIFDGWADGSATGNAGIVVGDNGADRVHGVISFDTSSLPDQALITEARFYLTRESAVGSNPFASGALGIPTVDVVRGSFGTPELEPGDATAPADYTDAGFVAGTALTDGHALGVELDPTALDAVNPEGLTQFRVSFPATGGGTGSDAVTFTDGDATTPPGGFPSLAAYMGTAAPFLDVTYETQTGVGEDSPVLARLLANSPNPFRSSTSIRFLLGERGPVRLSVFDVQGRQVVVLRDGVLDAGPHAVTWDGRDERGVRVSSGVYFAQLRAGGEGQVVRMILADR